MELAGFKRVNVHVSTIKHGDTIVCLDGLIRTIGRKNISKGFMGTSLYGDSYNLGTKLVTKILV